MCGFFFVNQKTAYEMRISDWSSDVCSSDLQPARELIAFLVDHDIAIAASGREDDRRAIGFGGAEDVEPRARDALEHPVAGVWVVAPLPGFFDDDRGRNDMSLGPWYEIGKAAWRVRGCQSVWFLE